MATDKGLLWGRYRPEELIDIFSFLSTQEMEELFPYLDLREWQSGEIVLKSGDPGDFMGFLLEGKLAVRLEGMFPDKFILVAVLEPGSLVGEISAVVGGRRHATVVASEGSRMLVLTQKNMELMLQQAPTLGLKLFRRIIHVLGHRLYKASDRLSKLL